MKRRGWQRQATIEGLCGEHGRGGSIGDTQKVTQAGNSRGVI